MSKPTPLYHIEKIAEWLQTADIPNVFKDTDISIGTLYAIKNGKTGVHYQTVLTLSAYMDQQKSNG